MRVLNKAVNQRIGRAMHLYKMLANGDSIMIAVSGGIDSLVLTWLLDFWRKKAPINYDLLAVHLDMGFDETRTGSQLVAEQLSRLSVPYIIEQTDFGRKATLAENGKSTCFYCSRQRRNRLFEIAATKGMSKIAFGHHKDDILETFFLNLLYGGNISTMIPKQEIFNGRLSLIRPLAFVEKKEILNIGSTLGIKPVKNPCIFDGQSKRQEVRSLLDSLYNQNAKVKGNVFAALGNIRHGYQLNDIADNTNEGYAHSP